jgi:hypothetical protein
MNDAFQQDSPLSVDGTDQFSCSDVTVQQEKNTNDSAGFTSWKEVFLVEEYWESLPHEPITLATQVKRGGELKSNRSLSKMEKNGCTKLPELPKQFTS